MKVSLYHIGTSHSINVEKRQRNVEYGIKVNQIHFRYLLSQNYKSKKDIIREYVDYNLLYTEHNVTSWLTLFIILGKTFNLSATVVTKTCKLPGDRNSRSTVDLTFAMTRYCTLMLHILKYTSVKENVGNLPKFTGEEDC